MFLLSVFCVRQNIFCRATSRSFTRPIHAALYMQVRLLQYACSIGIFLRSPGAILNSKNSRVGIGTKIKNLHFTANVFVPGNQLEKSRENSLAHLRHIYLPRGRQHISHFRISFIARLNLLKFLAKVPPYTSIIKYIPQVCCFLSS